MTDDVRDMPGLRVRGGRQDPFVFEVFSGNDAHARFAVDADGEVWQGDGTAPPASGLLANVDPEFQSTVSVTPPLGDTPLMALTHTSDDSTTAATLRPFHYIENYLRTSAAPGSDDPFFNTSQGLTSTLNYGSSEAAPLGTVHNMSLRTIIAGSGDTNNEVANIFSFLRAENAAAARMWFTDWGMHGPIGAQNGLMVGLSLITNNYYNGQPTSGDSAAAWLTTKPGTGAGTTTAHQAATTYPMGLGLGIGGHSGTPDHSTLVAQGFKVGLQVGGISPHWGGVSRIGTGVLVQDHDDYGLRVKARYTGASTAAAFVVEAGAGYSGFNLVSGDKPAYPIDINSTGVASGIGLHMLEGAMLVERTNTTDAVFRSQVIGDPTTARYVIAADGAMSWGTGAATRDTSLIRQAVSTLEVGGVLRVNTTTQNALAVAPNGAGGDSGFMAVVGTRSRFGYAGAVGAIQIDDGASSANKDFQISLNGSNRFKVYAAGYVEVFNRTGTPPTPTGAGRLYVESGALKYVGSSGTVTTLGNA